MSSLQRFFAVVARPSTWLNVVYLAASFPLGLFYFVFLVTGLSLGLGLIVVWVGIPILLVTVGAWWVFGAFERQQSRALLGVAVAPSARSWEQSHTVWGRIERHFRSPSTWLDLLHSLMKLPFGLVSFVLLIVALSSTLFVLALPIASIADFAVVHGDGLDWVPPWWVAVLAVPAGILLFFAWLHVLVGWAWVCGRWALLVQGRMQTADEVPKQAPSQDAHSGQLGLSEDCEGERNEQD